MKHAITILENALEDIQRNDATQRLGNKSAGRLAKAMKWDCLEAIQLLRRHLAEVKKGGKP